MFKYLFGYKKNILFTEYLLELLLGYEKNALHNKIEITNSLKLNKNNISERGYELDIAIKMPDENIINLECYSSFERISQIKSLLYISKLFSGQLKKGDNIIQAKSHIQINIVKGSNIPSKNYFILSQDNEHSKFLNDLFEIRIINVEKIGKKDYNENERLKKLYAFLSANTDEEAKQAVKGDEILEKMYESADEFANGENEPYITAKQYYESLQEYHLHEKFEQGHQQGFEQGIEQGIEKGIVQSKIDIAKNMKNENYDIISIQKITGLSKEEILKL